MSAMAANPFDLSGKRAAVTGAFGRIGRGICKCLLETGAEVAALDISEPHVELAGLNGLSVHRFDMTDTDAIPAMVEAIDSGAGPLDVWVNCAYPRSADWIAPPEDVTPENFRTNVDWQMNATCTSAFAAARLMAERGGGSIVNIGSIYGAVSPDFSMYEGSDKFTPGAYCAIKGGIEAYSRWLAGYFGRKGVRVNVVSPGAVFDNQPREFIEKFSRKTMLGRLAQRSEIGWAVAFLASDAASYITGAVLPADGGYTAI